MRNDFNLVSRHPIHRQQQLLRLVRHDDDAPRHIGDAVDDVALHRCRFGKNSVKSSDDGNGQARQQRQDIVTGFATEDAEFMLQADDVELSAIEEVGCAHIVVEAVGVDLKAH